MLRENKTLRNADLTRKLEQIRLIVQECLVALSSSSAAKNEARKPRGSRTAGSSQIDFDLPVRAFMKAYAKPVSGHARFALLIVRLAKGKEGVDISMKEINHEWNKIRGLLGGELKRIYSTRAKENGWVDSKKHGVYTLRHSWRHILG